VEHARWQPWRQNIVHSVAGIETRLRHIEVSMIEPTQLSRRRALGGDCWPRSLLASSGAELWGATFGSPRGSGRGHSDCVGRTNVELDVLLPDIARRTAFTAHKTTGPIG